MKVLCTLLFMRYYDFIILLTITLFADRNKMKMKFLKEAISTLIHNTILNVDKKNKKIFLVRRNYF